MMNVMTCGWAVTGVHSTAGQTARRQAVSAASLSLLPLYLSPRTYGRKESQESPPALTLTPTQR